MAAVRPAFYFPCNPPKNIVIFFQRIFAIIERLKKSTFSRAFAKSNLGYAGLSLLVLVVLGTTGFHLLEGWPLLDALYATIITLTTVGYGDLSPQTAGGRIFAIFFTLGAVGIAGYAISIAAVFFFEWELKRLRRVAEKQKMKQISELKDHIIICGSGPVGKRVANEFHKNQTPFILVDPKEESLRWAMLFLHDDYVSKRMRQFRELDFETYDTSREESQTLAELAEATGVLYLQEEPTQDRTLIRAGINRAKGVITVLEDDKENLFVVISARRLAQRLGNEKLRIISRVVEEENFSKLYAAGADKVASPYVVGGFQIASNMLNPELGAFWDDMLYRPNDGREVIRFMDLPITEQTQLAGQTVAEAKLRAKMVVALKRNGQFELAPADNTRLELGDVLIVLGSPS